MRQRGATPPRLGRRLLTLLATGCLMAASLGTWGSTAQAQTAQQPNIIILLTDDQRADTIDWPIPRTRHELDPFPSLNAILRDGGALKFTAGYVANALCCPSRASLLTGAYPHTTHVYRNSWNHTCDFAGEAAPCGGAALDPQRTIATWLDAAGYETHLIGKYLNGFEGVAAGSLPGWDQGHVKVKSGPDESDAYVDLTLQEWDTPGPSVERRYCDLATCEQWPGAGAMTYSTDLYSQVALDFIQEQEDDDAEPFFLYVAFNAPHSSDRVPEPIIQPDPPGYAALYDRIPVYRPESHNEADVSDKPSWLDDRPPIPTRAIDDKLDVRDLDRFREQQYRALRPVDDAVGAIHAALAAAGELDDTVIVFTSDNGFLWGEHRLARKSFVYEESIRVPFVVIAPGLVEAGRTDRLANQTCHPPTGVVCPIEVDPISLIDIVPTIGQLAGLDPADPSAPPFEGVSQADQLSQDLDAAGVEAPRSDVFIEAGPAGTTPPPYCAVRTGSRHPAMGDVDLRNVLYAEYTRDAEPLRYEHRELYDMGVNRFTGADRLQLHNRSAARMSNAWVEVRTALRSILYDTVDGLCDPPPPGFTRP